MAKAPAKTTVRLWLVGKNSYKILGSSVPQVKRGQSTEYPADKAAQLLKTYGTISRNGTTLSVPAFVDSAQVASSFLGYDVEAGQDSATLGGEEALGIGEKVVDHVEIKTTQQGGLNIG